MVEDARRGLKLKVCTFGLASISGLNGRGRPSGIETYKVKQ